MSTYCPQYFANFAVEGSTTGQSWLVSTHGPHAVFCSCPAYRYSGDYANQTCKHIQAVKELGCFQPPHFSTRSKWDPTYFTKNDIAIISTLNDSIHGPLLGSPCPGCGDPMITPKP